MGHHPWPWRTGRLRALGKASVAALFGRKIVTLGGRPSGSKLNAAPEGGEEGDCMFRQETEQHWNGSWRYETGMVSACRRADTPAAANVS